jgi:hypothetical protein
MKVAKFRDTEYAGSSQEQYLLDALRKTGKPDMIITPN